MRGRGIDSKVVVWSLDGKSGPTKCTILVQRGMGNRHPASPCMLPTSASQLPSLALSPTVAPSFCACLDDFLISSSDFPIFLSQAISHIPSPDSPSQLSHVRADNNSRLDLQVFSSCAVARLHHTYNFTRTLYTHTLLAHFMHPPLFPPPPPATFALVHRRSTVSFCFTSSLLALPLWPASL